MPQFGQLAFDHLANAVVRDQDATVHSVLRGHQLNAHRSEFRRIEPDAELGGSILGDRGGVGNNAVGDLG